MRPNRIVLVVGILVVVPLIVFLAFGFKHDPREIDSPLVGRSAPLFSLTDLTGGTVRLDELVGQPVVINFWATWCQPCIAEHPVLVDGARRYQGRVRFLGVIYQDDPKRIQGFLDRRGAWGQTLIDPESAVAIAYGVYGAPETFFIDRTGKITRKHTGPIDPRTLDGILGGLL